MKDRIKELRKALKMNQTQFGEKLGLATTGISSIETGERVVQERHLKLILSAFPNVSEKWLRSGEGEMITPRTDVEQIIAKYSFDGICAEMVRTFAELGQEEQEIVLEYTQHFISNLLSDRAKKADENQECAADQPIDPEIKQKTEAYQHELIVEKDIQTSSASGTGNAESA